MRARPGGRAANAPLASTSAFDKHYQPSSSAIPHTRCASGSDVNSRGAGFSLIGSCADVCNALVRLNQTFFESMAISNPAWSHIVGAAKRFSIKVSDETMPRPKIKEPSPGDERARAIHALILPPSGGGDRNSGSPPLKREGPGERVFSVFAVAITSDDAPEWVELIPAGKFSAVDGRGPFENADPDSVVAASTAKMPQVGLVLDYDHSTDLAAPEGRPSPAAGWLKEFKVEHGAIFARIEWTADAAEAVKAKKYRYVSPVFEHSEDGTVERILRAALTNNPALMNLPAIAHAMASSSVILSPESSKELKDQRGAIMAKKEKMAAGGKSISEIVAGLEELFPEMDPKKMLEMAEAALGEHDEDDEDEGMAAGEDPYEHETAEQMAARQSEEMARCSTDGERSDMAKKHAEEKERFAAQQNKGLEHKAKPGGGPGKDVDGSEKMSSKEIDAAVAKHPMVVKMAEDLNRMREAQAKASATDAVDAAIREGRLIPSQRDWAIEYCSGDPQGFEKFIGAQPKILRNGADGTFTARIGEPPKGMAALEQREIEIFANLGLETPEQLQKCAAVKEKWTLRFPRPRLMLDDTNSGVKE